VLLVIWLVAAVITFIVTRARKREQA
jgi:hypothetical protein